MICKSLISRLLLLITYFTVFTGGIQAQWVRLKTNVNDNLTDVDFLDAGHGYVLGDHVILKTIDGGISFSDITPEKGLYYKKMQFVTNDVGFLLSGNYIFRTLDGGETYSKNICLNYFGWTMSIDDFYFTDSLHGTCYSDVNFYFTDDGGVTWPNSAIIWQYPNSRNNEFNSFGDKAVFSRTEFDISGFFTSDLFYLENGSWFFAADELDYQSITASSIYSDSILCYLTAESGDFYLYDFHSNMRLPQNYSSIPGSHIFNDIIINEDKTGFVCGRREDASDNLKGGEILSTTDKGTSWKTDLIDPLNYQFYKLSFPDNHTGYAVGSYGSLWKWNSDLTATIENEIVSVFPNPANDFITFIFGKNYQTGCYLKIYNVLGVPIGKDLSYNSQGATASLDGLIPGTYYYSLINNGRILTGGSFVIM